MKRLGAAVLAGWMLSMALTGCDGGRVPETDGDRLHLAASVFPLADVVRQIGGEQVRVVTLLPPGATPHGFEPPARTVEELASCRLLVMVGRGMDLWAPQAARAARPEMRLLQMASTAAAAEQPHHHHAHGEPCTHAHGHHHEAGDPHVWLDPVLMKAFVPKLTAEMARLAPKHQEVFERRAAAFIKELDALDGAYREAVAGWKIKAFVVFHPAFTYLAERYGLTQETLAASHAEEGGPEALERVVAFVKEHRLRVIFAEPQFPADKLRWLEEQSGVRVGRLDPLGSPDVAGYDSYPAMMRSNLKALADAMAE